LNRFQAVARSWCDIDAVNNGGFASTIELQKTAVVVVHGIGEQRPLDTLLRFVGDGTGNLGILGENDPDAYVNPDPVSKMTYLRRITINSAPMTQNTDTHLISGDRPERGLARAVDFYEYYWAYRFRDTTWHEVTSWIGTLLRIRRDDISPYTRDVADAKIPSPLRGSENSLVRRCLWVTVSVLWLALLSDGLALTVPVIHARIAAAIPPQWWIFALLGVAAVVMSGLMIAAMGPLGLISVARIVVTLVVLCLLVSVAATMNWSAFQTSCRWAGALLSVVAVGVLCLLLWGLRRRAAKVVSDAGTTVEEAATADSPEEAAKGQSVRWPLRHLVTLSIILFALLAIALGGLILSVWDAFEPSEAVLAAAIPSTFAAAALVTSRAILSGVGDAARYLSNSPDDVDQREKIRTGLVNILERLHSQMDIATGLHTYDRVMVVGHSLGSVIAYDAIRALWTTTVRDIVLPADGTPDESVRQELLPSGIEPTTGEVPEVDPTETVQDGIERSEDRPQTSGSSGLPERANAARLAALRSLESLVVQESADAIPEKNYTRPMPSVASTGNWISAQRGIQALLRYPSSDPHTPNDSLTRWIISDLITVGSPLAHAELLLANGQTDLTQRKQRRLFPADPPAYSSVRLSTPKNAVEADKTILSMLRSTVSSLQPPVGDTTRMLSAAPFAAVTWTNIHFQHDMVGGRLSQVLGNGIDDVTLPEVKPYLLNFLLKYPHSSYWKGKRNRPETAVSCQCLRKLLLAPHPVLRVAGEAEAVARFADWLYTEGLGDDRIHGADGGPQRPVVVLRILVLAPGGVRQDKADQDLGSQTRSSELGPTQWLWPGASPLLTLDAAVRISEVVNADSDLQLCLSTAEGLEPAAEP
jgi:hypothetical protein